MPTSTLAVTATATPAGGGPLSIQNAGIYDLVMDGVAQGATSWRRITVDSNYVPGRSLTHAVRDVEIGVVTIRVHGDNLGQLQDRIDALTAVFFGNGYTVSIDFDGMTLVWNDCEPADCTIGTAGDNLSGYHMMSLEQSVTFTVPHTPGWA